MGGGTGALTGAAVDRFNRQLNQDEKKAIHDKANDNADEEKRLTQAACYRVQCWAEFSPNSPQWLANYVDPMDAKDLAPELQWIDSQKANKGLFDYTLLQQAKDLGLSQVDQFKRGVSGFGQDAKNLPRDVANSRVKLPTDVQQGDANPQIDPNSGGPKTPSGPAGATVTVGAVPCGPVALCPTVTVAPVVTPGGPILSSGSNGGHDSSANKGGDSTGFSKGISADEISEINQKFGGSISFRDVDTVLSNAASYDGFYEKSASIIRDIAGGHLFDNGNKRTAVEVVEALIQRNSVDGPPAGQIWSVVDRVAIGQLRDVKDISQALRGLK